METIYLVASVCVVLSVVQVECGVKEVKKEGKKEERFVRSVHLARKYKGK